MESSDPPVSSPVIVQTSGCSTRSTVRIGIRRAAAEVAPGPGESDHWISNTLVDQDGSSGVRRARRIPPDSDDAEDIDKLLYFADVSPQELEVSADFQFSMDDSVSFVDGDFDDGPRAAVDIPGAVGREIESTSRLLSSLEAAFARSYAAI
jgi:hypothetical protein